MSFKMQLSTTDSFDQDPLTRFEYRHDGVRYSYISKEGYTYRDAHRGCDSDEVRKFNNRKGIAIPLGMFCVSTDPIDGYDTRTPLEKIWDSLVPDDGSEFFPPSDLILNQY